MPLNLFLDVVRKKGITKNHRTPPFLRLCGYKSALSLYFPEANVKTDFT